jgi:hypothetical protein
MCQELQDELLENLQYLCVTQAARVWGANAASMYKHRISRKEGELQRKLTWIRRAIQASRVIKDWKFTHKPITRGFANSMIDRLSPVDYAPGLGVSNGNFDSEEEITEWQEKAKVEKKTTLIELDEIHRAHLKERAERKESFLVKEGITNTSIFRRWRSRGIKDPDGEAVKSNTGEILVLADQIVDRFYEYYSTLLAGEASRSTPVDEGKRKLWMDDNTIQDNESKLLKALDGRDIGEETPTFDEYFDAVSRGEPTSSPGIDGVQYGVLQYLSYGVHKVIHGMICAWWRKRDLPNKLRVVEICSLHKKGDRLNLFNKRGIGLVSKFILIMETILLRRIAEALDKAGTRSKAQGGATKGIQVTDTILTLVNVVSHARRRGKPLHIVEFDLYKFFDSIPHRAFEDAFLFFGFNKLVIELSRLFWENFWGQARTKYGSTKRFRVGVGNIQGLVGSPLRSSLVLDMLLLLLERRLHGYRFCSDAFGANREHELDEILLLIYAIAWVDDIWLMDEDYTKISAAVRMFNDFVTHYNMKCVADKCHHYYINDRIEDSERLQLVDYNGVVDIIPVVPQEEAFRCLGIFFNIKLNWSEHINNLKIKLRDVANKLQAARSPPSITAKFVNSNVMPAVLYGLGVVELNDNEIRSLQCLLNRPVRTDGFHSIFISNKAYTLGQKEGGYAVSSVEANYRASKVSSVYKMLNGSYAFAKWTTRITILDLQRKATSVHHPLSGKFTAWHLVRRDGFPQYIKSTGKALATVGGAILPRTAWDLSSITIETFAQCVAGWDGGNIGLKTLASHNIVYMRDLSPAFIANVSAFGVTCNEIQRRILLYNNTLVGGSLHPVLFDQIQCLKGIGAVIASNLVNMVTSGITNISFCGEPRMYAPIPAMQSAEWQRYRLPGLASLREQKGNWYTDGSKLKEAAFGVVNDEGVTIASGRIGGRSTSQRGECAGLYVASLFGPNKNKYADPFWIVNSINRSINNVIPHYKWISINNRSWIRAITHVNGEGNFTWVEGHQGTEATGHATWNKVVDRVARKASVWDHALVVQDLWQFGDEYIFWWKRMLYEGDIRKKIVGECSKLERETFLGKQKNLRFRHDGWWMVSPKGTTSFRYAAIRFKAFTHTFATYKHLSKRFPELYNSLKCPGCNEEVETDIHVFNQCGAYDELRFRTINDIEETLRKAGKNNKRLDYICASWIRRPSSLNDEHKGLWFLGGLPDKIRDLLCRHMSLKEAEERWQDVHEITMKCVLDIWNRRCEVNRVNGGLFAELARVNMERAMLSECEWNTVQEVGNNLEEYQDAEYTEGGNG